MAFDDKNLGTLFPTRHGETIGTDNVNTHQLVSYAARFALAAASAHPSAMSSDELLNLSGQLKTSMARCKETGAIDELYAALPKAVADELRAML